MSSLIQETEQELMKHFCKLCDKSFPSGRSLGGHMRSHVINSTDHHHHQKQQQQMKKLSSVNNGGKSMNNTTVLDGSSNSNDSGYELRKDPKRTPKVKDSSEVENNNSNCLVVLDKLCKECGKGFQSWKALFGHMKCHSDKLSNNHNLNQDSWTSSQSDNENSGGRRIKKKSRSRNARIKRYITATVTTTTTTTITTASSSISMNANNNNNNNNQISNHASTSVVSEIDQDQESEIAMCLMMLSRDDGKWGNEFESSDYCNSSAFVRLSTKVEGKKPLGNGSKIKKLAETQVGVHYLGRSEVGSTGLEKIMSHNHEFNDESKLGFAKTDQDSSKRKFECATCNKSFDSYQALGGHKASHKKIKGCLDPKTQPLFNHQHMINGFCAKPSDNNHQTTKSFNLGVNSLKKTVVLGSHECPICFKIFSSGQALGGHKRSHIIAEAKLNQETNMNLIEKVNEPIHGFLDLNMLPVPDTIEEEMMMNNNSTGYNPWYWIDSSHSTNHESTTLLGLLSS